MEDVHPLYDDDDESDADNHHPMDHFMQNMANIAKPFMAMGGMGVGPFAMMGPHFVGGGGIPFAPFNFDVDVDSDDAGLDEMMPMQMFHQGKNCFTACPSAVLGAECSLFARVAWCIQSTD